MTSRPLVRAGAAELVVPGEPGPVYEVVSDVTRIGERSSECRSAHWLAGPPPGTVGAVFVGVNRSGRVARWSRRCEVLVAERGREFAFRTLPERRDPSRRDSTTWRYELEAVPGGTRVRHSFDITVLPLAPFRWLYGLLLPHHRDVRPQVLANLQALRDQFAAAPAPDRVTPEGAVRRP